MGAQLQDLRFAICDLQFGAGEAFRVGAVEGNWWWNWFGVEAFLFSLFMPQMHGGNTPLQPPKIRFN
jgi:hypothetical protein